MSQPVGYPAPPLVPYDPALGAQTPPQYPTAYPPLPGAHEGGTGVGAALLSAGVPLDFTDGVQRVLRYDFLSMLAIEEEYGSIKALLDKVEVTPDPDAGEYAALATPIMGVCADLIRFGLYDGTRFPTRHECARLMEPSLLGDYVEQASVAISQAFGPKAPPSKDGQPVDPTTASTGSGGGPSQPGATSSAGSGV
jgi:hypothetical protein